MLKRKTFTDAGVVTYFNAHFVDASFDGEAGDGIMLANKFQIQGYPALFILDEDGKVVATTMGYQSPVQLLQFAREAGKVK